MAPEITLMASRPLLVTQSGRLTCSVPVISLGKDTKVEIELAGLQERQEGGKVNNGTVHNRGCLIHLDLHTQQITLLPTSTEGLSIPPALLFTKDQTQEIMIVVTATESTNRK